jgi:hypothetical protein
MSARNEIDAAFREVDKAFQHVDVAFDKVGKAINEEMKKPPRTGERRHPNTGKVVALTWRNRWRLIQIAFSRAKSVRF